MCDTEQYDRNLSDCLKHSNITVRSKVLRSTNLLTGAFHLQTAQSAKNKIFDVQTHFSHGSVRNMGGSVESTTGLLHMLAVLVLPTILCSLGFVMEICTDSDFPFAVCYRYWCRTNVLFQMSHDVCVDLVLVLQNHHD